MDIREFAQDFLNEVKASVEMNGTDYDQELASLIFDYMEDNGEHYCPRNSFNISKSNKLIVIYQK